MAANDGDRVRLDLNSPEFQDVFFRLEANELRQVVASLRRLRSLTWSEVYRHTGFRWEAVRHIRTPTGATAYSAGMPTVTLRRPDACAGVGIAS